MLGAGGADDDRERFAALARLIDFLLRTFGNALAPSLGSMALCACVRNLSDAGRNIGRDGSSTTAGLTLTRLPSSVRLRHNRGASNLSANYHHRLGSVRCRTRSRPRALLPPMDECDTRPSGTVSDGVGPG
jgi:hypothetical protein